MLNPQALQLRVGVDVGSQCHSVAVGLTDGSLLEEFELIGLHLFLLVVDMANMADPSLESSVRMVTSNPGAIAES